MSLSILYLALVATLPPDNLQLLFEDRGYREGQRVFAGFAQAPVKGDLYLVWDEEKHRGFVEMTGELFPGTDTSSGSFAKAAGAVWSGPRIAMVYGKLTAIGPLRSKRDASRIQRAQVPDVLPGLPRYADGFFEIDWTGILWPM